MKSISLHVSSPVDYNIRFLLNEYWKLFSIKMVELDRRLYIKLSKKLNAGLFGIKFFFTFDYKTPRLLLFIMLYYIIYYIINIFTGFRLNTFITKKNGLYCAWLFLQPLKNSLYASGF